MTHLYILQMHSASFPSRIIKRVTRYPYSHVGICLTEDCDRIYSFGRKNVHNFMKGGFTVERKDGMFYQKFYNTQCRIFVLEVEPEQYAAICERLSVMERDQQNYKYDFIGLFLRCLHIPVTFRNRYVCSQFVAELLEDADLHYFNKKTRFVRPKDFEKLADLREIYCGKYADYRADTLSTYAHNR